MYVQSISEKIQQRRYQMLVHSYLYYQLGESIVSDHDFDRWANELVWLQKTYTKESKVARFYDEFEDFDGSSGFDLPYTMTSIQVIGDKLLRNHNGRNYNEN
jgi:hypothetical protein